METDVLALFMGSRLSPFLRQWKCVRFWTPRSLPRWQRWSPFPSPSFSCLELSLVDRC